MRLWRTLATRPNRNGQFLQRPLALLVGQQISPPKIVRIRLRHTLTLRSVALSPELDEDTIDGRCGRFSEASEPAGSRERTLFIAIQRRESGANAHAPRLIWPSTRIKESRRGKITGPHRARVGVWSSASLGWTLTHAPRLTNWAFGSRASSPIPVSDSTIMRTRPLKSTSGRQFKERRARLESPRRS